MSAAMDARELERRLAEDARNEVPPFGASSVALARAMGSAAKHVLLGHIGANARSAFLALEALRVADAPAYVELPASVRATVYVDALQTQNYFNAWGVPGQSLSAAAEALIALGDAALARLRPLLSNRASAPLSGSKDATVGTAYANRVCDYAWVLISEILGRTYRYAREPGERDRQIDALRSFLAEQGRGS